MFQKPKSLLCAVSLFLLFCVGLVPSITLASAPQVLYTDLASGPNMGGENNNGAYLSIFGVNFGSTGLGSSTRVYVNNSEVARYIYLGPSKGRADIQQVIVQIGSIGNPTPGVALPIKVVVNGVASNTDKTFMVQPGDFLFVDNVSGNDSTAIKNDITHPWRFVQGSGTNALTGAVGVANPGDIIVMRGKGVTWTDLGFNDSGSIYFLKFRKISGSQPTGVKGTGPITLMGYPMEDVYIDPGNNVYGVISGVNGDTYPSDSNWITIADLRVAGGTHDGPIDLQWGSDNWRVINNDVSAPLAPTSSRSGGIAGSGISVSVLGNHIHDVAGDGQTNHGIYIERDHDYEIAYNNIHNITGGNGIQLHNSVGATSGTNGGQIINVNIHHNLVHDVQKHGLNIGSFSATGITIYDNVVYNTYRSGIRFCDIACLGYTGNDLHGAIIVNNDFYNTDTSANSVYAVMSDDTSPGGLASDALNFKNNILVPSSGTAYVYNISSSKGSFSNNLWYGVGSAPTWDVNSVNADPLFINSLGNPLSFLLNQTSPAINKGVTTIATTDFNMVPRPQGTAFSIGAYEFCNSGCAPVNIPPPSSPVGLTVR